MRKYGLIAALGLILVAGAAYASGIYVNGMPLAAFPLTGNEQFGVDTQLPSGQNPQSEAISTTQMATFTPAPTVLTDGATIALDASKNNVYTVTLGGNRTLSNPTNLVAGKQWKVIVTQDGTGSRTLAYGNDYYWVAGAGYGSSTGTAPTLATSTNAANVLEFIYNGSSILGKLFG